MNTKLHLVGVALIVVLTLIVLIATGRIHLGEQPPAVDPRLAEYFVQIENASWGLNCLTDPSVPKSTASNLPSLRQNNVLRGISSLCNGQSTCQIELGGPGFGDDPAPKCTKRLNIDYRCRSLDPLKHVSADTGSLTLECLPSAPAAPATAK